jgi:hypothetical protein
LIDLIAGPALCKLAFTTRGQPPLSATIAAGRSGTDLGRSPAGTACTIL